MAIENFVVALAMLAGLIVLAISIRGSLRRGPTLSDRYEAASEAEKVELDKQMERSWWQRANMRSLAGWEIAAALLGFALLMVVKTWLKS